MKMAEASTTVFGPILTSTGWRPQIEGQNLDFDVRVGQQRDTLPSLMGELLAARPAAVIAVGQDAIVTAGAASRTVPIVSFGGNLVELGLEAAHTMALIA
jgi:hypothetical protein